ncbi:MAG: type VII toxin-antitoxin system MntA family adenylyltransferase antitoxin [Thermodesulfobacteriota bacterium]
MENLKETIQSCCRNYPEIVAAYLFGSIASGKNRVESDIDLGIILFQNQQSHFDFLAFSAELSRQTGKEPDVIVLNRAGEILKHEVRKKGRLIYETDPRARKDFEIKGRKTFEDFLYLHRRYVEKVIYGV